MVRLYKAWSLLDNFMGQTQVQFDWFVIGRAEAVAPYDELIAGYDENDEDAAYDRLLADEFFTASELEELKRYLLKAHGLEVHAEEVLLPLPTGGLSYELLLISGQKGFYALADEAGYDLDFAVLGHYPGEWGIPADALSETDLSQGVDFMEKALAYLNISGIEKNDLYVLLNAIHSETGYYIVKAPTWADMRS